MERVVRLVKYLLAIFIEIGVELCQLSTFTLKSIDEHFDFFLGTY